MHDVICACACVCSERVCGADDPYYIRERAFVCEGIKAAGVFLFSFFFIIGARCINSIMNNVNDYIRVMEINMRYPMC